jgi:hypothetical protein
MINGNLSGLPMKFSALCNSLAKMILQSETQEELDALLPSVLDRAFKGELC